jgi:hypothetical protein
MFSSLDFHGAVDRIMKMRLSPSLRVSALPERGATEQIDL